MPSAEERAREAFEAWPDHPYCRSPRAAFLAGHASRDPEVAALVEALEALLLPIDDEQAEGELYVDAIAYVNLARRMIRAALAQHKDGRR